MVLYIYTAGMCSLGLHFNPQISPTLCICGLEPGFGVLPPGETVLPQQGTYCYLGVRLSIAADTYECHKRHIREVAQQGTSVLRRCSLWESNRYIMVRVMQKTVRVPALTFANAVTCIPAAAREWLERRQCEVGRLVGRLNPEVIRFSRDSGKMDKSIDARSLSFLSIFVCLASFVYFPRNVETPGSSY